MKAKLMKVAASLVSLVASLSAEPLCVFVFHQPKVPDRLINK
jgi:cyclic lactone autoinducer peptide